MHKAVKSEESRALKKAFDLLARRAHSRAELARKLATKDFSAEVIDTTLSKCEQLGFINDRQFGQFYIEELQRKGYGQFRLREKLYLKGLAQALIDELVEQCSSESELNLCREAGRKKAVLLKQEKDSAKRRQKLYRYLVSRGFSGDTVQQVLEELETDGGRDIAF